MGEVPRFCSLFFFSGLLWGEVFKTFSPKRDCRLFVESQYDFFRPSKMFTDMDISGMSVPDISENVPDISGFVPVISEKRS